jgi:hypothetical protein
MNSARLAHLRSRRTGLRTLGSLCAATALPLWGLGACSSAPNTGPANAPWPPSPPRSSSTAPLPPGSPAPEATTSVPTDPNAPPAAPTVPPIASEKRWLDEWFAKTPVVIRQLNESTLQLTVPMANSFDLGQVPPKPALVAVLDRIAESMRRQVNTRLAVLVSPDTGAPTSQAVSRAQKLSDHLISRRVQAQRIITSRTGVPGAPVQLQLQFLTGPVM